MRLGFHHYWVDLVLAEVALRFLEGVFINIKAVCIVRFLAGKMSVSFMEFSFHLCSIVFIVWFDFCTFKRNSGSLSSRSGIASVVSNTHKIESTQASSWSTISFKWCIWVLNLNWFLMTFTIDFVLIPVLLLSCS